MTTIYTIGFTGKSAEEFFKILKNAEVKRVIDIRLYPSTQLSGFARKKDLAFFLKSLCGIGYQQKTFSKVTKIRKYLGLNMKWNTSNFLMAEI